MRSLRAAAALAALLHAASAGADPSAGPWGRGDAAASPWSGDGAASPWRQSRDDRRLADAERAGDGAPSAAAPLRTGCGLLAAESDAAHSRDCLACHAGASGGHANHPVDVDYAAARARTRGLRATGDVIARGVLLPFGEVRCVTCHERRSRFRDHLAIPPGAMVRPAVSPRDRSTWERAAAARPPASLAAGAAVSPTPLCLACHGLD